MKLLFNKESVLKRLKGLLEKADMEECKFEIGEMVDELTTEDIKDEYRDVIHFVENLTDEDIVSHTKYLPTKKNGRFRQGGVSSLCDIGVSDYVTDFTNCWYHDRLALRAIDEDTVEIALERTQTTH